MSEYKITILGAGGVGKSAIVMRFVHSKFVEKYDPTIEDSYRKTVDVDGQACQLDILDTAGQEEYSNIQDDYIKNGQGFIIVYSVTSSSSFDDAKTIRKKILEKRHETNPTEVVPIVLVGNKTDLDQERGVEHEEGSELAQSWGCTFYETSAKDDQNIEEVFTDIIRQINRGGFDPRAAEVAEAEAAHKDSQNAQSDDTNKPKPATTSNVQTPPAPRQQKKKKCTLL